MKKILLSIIALLVLGVSANAQENSLTVAEAKATAVSSSNRNTEFTLVDEMLVTGKFGPNVYVEANGVGLQISGITAEKGDIITKVVGKLGKVSYAKNIFNATSTEFTTVSTGNEVKPLVVDKADLLSADIDARLVEVNTVSFDEATASSNGVFNMTVTPAQSDLGVMMSVNGEMAFATPATVTGYMAWSQMGAAMASFKAVSIVKENPLTVAEAKSTAVNSSNRNTEFTLVDEMLVTGKFGSAVYVEADGVGLQITGLDADKVNKGDVITKVVGKLVKVSFAKNTFNATSTEFTTVSTGNEVKPLVVAKSGLMSADIDARLVSVEGVNFAEGAAAGGVFNMTITQADSDMGVMISTVDEFNYVKNAVVTGYMAWSQMGAAMASFKAVSIVKENPLTVAEAKSTAVNSSNRNTEFTLVDEMLVTGKFGSAVYVEADGVGLQITGLDADKVNKGDVIAKVVGKLVKVSFAKNTFNATSTEFTTVSTGNEVKPLVVAKSGLMSADIDARLVSVEGVNFAEGAAAAGVFNMTITQADSDMGVMISTVDEFNYVKNAVVTGYMTWSQIMPTFKATNITEDPVATGISNVEVATETVIYDLTGRRVAAPKAGQIYIVNGKKVVK